LRRAVESNASLYSVLQTESGYSLFGCNDFCVPDFQNHGQSSNLPEPIQTQKQTKEVTTKAPPFTPPEVRKRRSTAAEK